MSVSTVRWENTVNNVGRGVRRRNRLIEKRPHNWLLATYFLACAKSVAGKPLSDLETHLINSLRASPASDAIIGAMARSHRMTPPDLRHQIFPDRFASLGINDAVSFAALTQMAPSIVADVLGHPNMLHLHIPAIDADPTSVHNPVLAPMQAPALHFSANRYTIKAHGFRCLDESNEWSPSDEVYWLFGSAAKGYQMTNGTHIFNNVDKNEAKSFGSGEGCFWGMDCKPHIWPEGDIGGVATLYEHDEGNQSDVLKTWSAVFSSASGILLASGIASWAIAVVGAIGIIGGFIIELLNDDYIDSASWGWKKSDINTVLGEHGGSYDVTEIFSDSDATYRLRIRITRQV